MTPPGALWVMIMPDIMIPLAQIVLQAASLNPDGIHSLKAKLFARFMEEGCLFEPVIVQPVGRKLFELLDGHHRIFAARILGRSHLLARVVGADLPPGYIDPLALVDNHHHTTIEVTNMHYGKNFI
jgi:ParB-like nuclease domain